MTKNKEIALLQKNQKALKKEIIEIKKKLPTYIIGAILFTFVGLFFLENNFYDFFGNGVDIILYGVILSATICLILVYVTYLKINKKKKESKAIGTKVYNIMKLADDSKNG
ncbi:hypothetical protein [Polaribacter aquimarinus]|uniref:Uncharacterized protein n=1 Tax=Polaribacter aquimarinus TaxID=2100726 RepID=A0A2U2JAI8_9FLAO|nr:hypothetical protein [Polaribacter aquimarinus]PWG05357.1 hypothetical protein DIS07_08985 [Polaribacter aquimarinus]